jgi:hypothetical protein
MHEAWLHLFAYATKLGFFKSKPNLQNMSWKNMTQIQILKRIAPEDSSLFRVRCTAFLGPVMCLKHLHKCPTSMTLQNTFAFPLGTAAG